MSFKARFKRNAEKPEGFLGTILINRMNIGTHSRLAAFGLGCLDFSKKDNCLDLGCGGGANLKRLAARCPDGSVSGIDYSEVSVRQSQRHNRRLIKSGKCSVKRADVLSLPFENDSFDKLTAFETVYFWQDIEKAFREVYRVTAQDGVFAVIQETEGNSPNAAETLEIIEKMRFYKAEEISALMQQAGFKNTKIFRKDGEAWFCVTGKK